MCEAGVMFFHTPTSSAGAVPGNVVLTGALHFCDAVGPLPAVVEPPLPLAPALPEAAPPLPALPGWPAVAGALPAMAGSASPPAPPPEPAAPLGAGAGAFE